MNDHQMQLLNTAALNLTLLDVIENGLGEDGLTKAETLLLIKSYRHFIKDVVEV